jgi:AcrR family transcriptional regulator
LSRTGRAPQQVSSVDRLLGAAGEILRTEGWPGFNTNAIASTAGVNISILYRHFPDKYAILRQVIVRSHETTVERLGPELARFAVADDLERWLDEVLDATFRLRVDDPTGMVARFAARAIPEFASVEIEIRDQFIAGFSPLVAARYPKASRQRVRNVTGLVWVVVTSAIDFMVDNDQPAPALLRELSVMVLAGFDSLDAG